MPVSGPGVPVSVPGVPVSDPLFVSSYETVQKGEIYRFTYKINYLPLIHKDTFVKTIKNEIERNAENYRLVSIHSVGEDYIIAELEVINNPLPFLAVFGIVVVGLSFLIMTFGLTLTKVERIVSKPVGAALSLATVAIAGITLYKLLF